ncbi:MAG: hypothetical protein QXO48_00040 [Desulfurococcaceae archaeon]
MRRVELALAVALFLGSVWRFALSPGYLFLAEQFETLDARLFLRATELWPNTEIFSEVDVGKLYLYWLLYAASGGNYKLLQTLALGLPVALAYLSASLFLGRFSRWGWLIALLYVFNPLFVNQPRDIQFRFEYALFPLALHLLLGALEGRRAYALGLALVLGMASYRFYAVFAVAALIITLWRLPRGISWRWLLFAVASGAALALPRVLPAVVHILEGGSLALATFGVTVWINRVDVLSALALNFYYPGDVFEKITHGVLNYGFLPVVFAAAVAAVRRRGGVALLGMSIVAVGALLTSTVNIDFLLSMSDILARLYRQPYWNGLLTLIGYLIVLSSAGDKRLIIAALPIPLALYAPIVFSGDMWGYWCAAEPPGAYWDLPNFGGKSLWIPGMGDFRAQWVRCGGPSWTSASAWRPTGIVEIRSWGGPALSLTYTGLFSQYFTYFNYLNYSGLPFATVSLDPRVAYGVVGISYVGVVYDRAFSGDLRRALQEAGVFFSRAGEEVVSSSELTVVKLGDATLCRIGGFLTLTGGYPALGALFSAFGWRAPPAVFSLFNASAVQGGDGVDGVPAAVVKFTAFKRQGLARGTGIVYDSFYREVAARGGIWPFDYITDFLYGDSGVAYGVVELPGGTYDVYVRGYVSNISGVLTLRLGSVEYNISLEADVARLRWVRVGRLMWRGGRVEVEACLSRWLVAVGELAFLKPVDGGLKLIYLHAL